MISQTPGSIRFVTTQWQVVRSAGSAVGRARQEALEQLVFQYRPALCDYLSRRYRVGNAGAEDLVQGFLLDKVLRENVLSLARSERGKFRTFLLTTINSYVIDQIRRESAQKRFPQGGFVGEDALAFMADNSIRDAETQDLFEESLARQLIAETLHKVRVHCKKHSMSDVWGIFNDRLLRPMFGQDGVEPFSVLRNRYELKSEKEARNKLVTGKRIFQKYFKERARVLLEEEGAEGEELQVLLQLLGESLQR